eukprot:2935090-Prymnesium_polylepis.1
MSSFNAGWRAAMRSTPAAAPAAAAPESAATAYASAAAAPASAATTAAAATSSPRGEPQPAVRTQETAHHLAAPQIPHDRAARVGGRAHAHAG